MYKDNNIECLQSQKIIMDSYFVNLERIAIDFNAGIAEVDFESIDGACMNGDKGYLICVDKKLDPYKRQWVLGHELWHIQDGTVDSFFSMISERRANKYALDTLIPDEKLKEAMEYYWENCEFMNQLFWVSVETMQKKCDSLQNIHSER